MSATVDDTLGYMYQVLGGWNSTIEDIYDNLLNKNVLLLNNIFCMIVDQYCFM